MYCDGAVYRGSWQRNERSGFGIVEFATAGERFAGRFEDGKLDVGVSLTANGRSILTRYEENVIISEEPYDKRNTTHAEIMAAASSGAHRALVAEEAAGRAAEAAAALVGSENAVQKLIALLQTIAKHTSGPLLTQAASKLVCQEVLQDSQRSSSTPRFVDIQGAGNAHVHYRGNTTTGKAHGLCVAEWQYEHSLSKEPGTITSWRFCGHARRGLLHGSGCLEANFPHEDVAVFGEFKGGCLSGFGVVEWERCSARFEGVLEAGIPVRGVWTHASNGEMSFSLFRHSFRCFASRFSGQNGLHEGVYTRSQLAAKSGAVAARDANEHCRVNASGVQALYVDEDACEGQVTDVAECELASLERGKALQPSERDCASSAPDGDRQTAVDTANALGARLDAAPLKPAGAHSIFARICGRSFWGAKNI